MAIHKGRHKNDLNFYNQIVYCLVVVMFYHYMQERAHCMKNVIVAARLVSTLQQHYQRMLQMLDLET